MTTIDAACRGCGTPWRPEARFCTVCGTPAPAPAGPWAAAPPHAAPPHGWAGPPGPPRPAPFPPAAPPPPPEPPRSSRGLIVAAGVLALVAVVLGAFLLVGTPWSAGAGTTTAGAPAPAAPPPPVETSGAPLPADPGQALQVQRAHDAAAVERMVGAWTPQLSAKKEGMVVDGRAYDAAAVLADHLRLRGAHPDAVLVWSGDWASFRGRDFWVTLVGRSFPSGDAANAWCADAGFGPDDCYAKRLTRSGSYSDNTRLRSGGGGGGAGAAPAGGTPTLGRVWAPNQTGFGAVRPTEVYAGGDPTGMINEVTWQSWGGPTATGRGTAYWMPPDGYVSQSVPRPAVIVASNLGDCGGQLAYRSVGWYFPTEGETSLAPDSGYDDICEGP